MHVDPGTARREPGETLTSNATSSRHLVSAAAPVARPRPEPSRPRPLISSGIQQRVCYLISGTRFAEDIGEATERWRRQKRHYRSLECRRIAETLQAREQGSARPCPSLHLGAAPGMHGYLFERIDQWVCLRGGGRGGPGPKFPSPLGERPPFVPSPDRPGGGADARPLL